MPEKTSFEDLISSSFPTFSPPPEGFKIFEQAEPWKMNACMNWSEDMSHGYTEGYLKAANRLVLHVQETESDQDYLVYPIVFLYRQHLELRLKEILNLLISLNERIHSVPSDHKLIQLWLECKPSLERLSPGDEKLWLNSITDCFEQIAEVDPISDAFRYPLRTDGNKSVGQITHINLKQLKDIMDPIAFWLSGTMEYLYDCSRNVRDIREEFY